jgi:hypothetical protein
VEPANPENNQAPKEDSGVVRPRAASEHFPRLVKKTINRDRRGLIESIEEEEVAS